MTRWHIKGSLPFPVRMVIREASAYFSIGTKKMRRLAEDNIGEFAVCSGNRYLIIREKFEKFIEESSAV